MSAVHVVVPAGIDDPTRPSGGNVYDRRVCDGLAATGWDVRELPVPGAWPRPDAAARSALARLVEAIPDGGVVLIDGLIASTAPEVLVPEAGRLRIVVLLHMPIGDGGATEDAERAVLTCARAVVTTSWWTREWIITRYGLSGDLVCVAHPGADVAGPAPATPDGGRLLCVAALVPLKGQDLLLEALTDVDARPWTCALVGSLDRDPDFVEGLRARAAASGIADRIRFAGAQVGGELRSEYLAADVLVLPSRFETYGMVVGEALAVGIPVIATAVGGVPEALGQTDNGRPGLLVPPGDRSGLAAALARWLGDPGLREQLRAAALDRRATVTGWDEAAGRVAAVLAAAAR